MQHGDYLPVLHGASADRPDEADTLVSALAVCAALNRLGYRSDIVRLGLDLGDISRLADRRPGLVFNLVEALDGDAALAAVAPAALDHFGLAYTGATAQAHHALLSKSHAKQLMLTAGLPTPAWSADGGGLPAGGRVIVKSLTEHASLGIDAQSVVSTEAAGAEIAARCAAFGGSFFAEAYIEGREFNLSLLETAEGPRVLPPAEIEFVDYPADRPRIVDYEAKWIEHSAAYRNTPRRFDFSDADKPLLQHLSDWALQAWRLFGLTGYARVDFRVDGAGAPWILEVNANPCLSPDAGFIAAAARAGLDYDWVIGSIVSSVPQTRRQAA